MTATDVRTLASSLSWLEAGETARVDMRGAACCPDAIAPMVAVADFHRKRGVDVALVAPDGTDVARAVAGFADGRLSPDAAGIAGDPFGRVWRFSSYDEMNAIVNAMILQLGKTALLGKGVKDAFIWCLDEVMDNVLTHSAPGGGAAGYVMAAPAAGAKRLKVCVFDLGIGMAASFAGSRYAPEDDYAAITLALKANVTSGLGQGNGLWGLHELIRRAKGGSLSVASGAAAYLFSPEDGRDGPAAYAPPAGFSGTTLVDFRMPLDGEISFDKVFPDSLPTVDLWQEAHETESGAVRYGVLEVAGGSGSRQSAAALRHIAENTLENDGRPVILDFAGVEFCSSAFIDELVGKLLVRYGFLDFTQKIRLENVRGLSAQIVNHSIMQRLAEAGGAA